MDDIVRSVEQVSHIIREISATTGAQSGEIGIVSESVRRSWMKMTQRNARARWWKSLPQRPDPRSSRPFD